MHINIGGKFAEYVGFAFFLVVFLN